VENGLIEEKDIDVAVRRLMTARFKLGMFDPDEVVPYAQIPFSVNTSEEHAESGFGSRPKKHCSC
jgi:beta-glucosidase